MTDLPLAKFHAQKMLESAIEELEQRAKTRESCNGFSVMSVAQAALLMNEHEILQRAQHLIRTLPDLAFGDWLTRSQQKRARTVPTIEKIREEWNPLFDRDRILARELGDADVNGKPNIALCIQGRYDEAIASAKNDLGLEEIGVTLAIMGEFDLLRRFLSEVSLPAFRKQGIEMIMTIELFRYCRYEEFDVALRESESNGLFAETRTHLSVGLIGREPWCGYPYPDW